MQFKNELIVFPTSRAIREYISSQNLNNTLLPKLLTIDDFFKKAITVKDREFIDEEQMFLYLKEAANISGLKKLGLSNTFSEFVKHSDYLFRFFGEMAAEKVTINDIKSVDTYEYYNEHLEILNTIYKNYISILDENFAIDKINLGQHSKINEEYIRGFENITIYFEGYFTNQEFDIIQNASKLSTVVIHFKVNEYNMKSIEKFKAQGFDLENNYKYIIDLSSRTIIEKNLLIKNKQEVRVKAFSSRVNQIAFIKKSIVDMISHGISKDKIVLVLPDESMKQQLELFDDEGYFNYAMGNDIFSSELYKSIYSINRYLNDNELTDIELLKFLKVDQEIIDATIKPIWDNKLQRPSFNKLIEWFKSFESNGEIVEKFDELVYKINHLFFKKEQNLSLKEATKILLQKLSNITLDDINSGAITVMGLLETRAVSFEGVIICDFNESFVPKRSVKDKFLSTKVKMFANLPTSIDRENLQKYYYLETLSKAKEVSICYVQNETMQISRFANELFNKKDIPHDVKDEEYKHILFHSKKLTHFDKEIKVDIDLSKNVWSATSLKIYLECKRKYYLQYIMGLKEHTISLKPQSYELGSIIHKILEMMYRSKEEITYNNLLKYFNEYKNSNVFLKFDLEVWKLKLKSFISLEEERMKNKFKVIDLEKTFLIEYQGIKLKGVIDRIDQVNDNYEVIDYKTSANLKVDTFKTYEKSKDFQLEFYFLACKDLLKSSNIKTYYYDLHQSVLREEIVLEEKLKMLEHYLKELNTTTVNFEKCDDKNVCQFCSYKTICDR